ncbi:hypothetical protein Fbal_3131 [Ferrimonas balearica DSM 9799]|uniref:Uncharacterized protein n=1 Tax=Ferrimonas balearica (strain DSM 9799 / CCM 4581 / KCTC 23876 / PAT) TaxID=550540 RepID=E1SV30_FERBD|nr:hypothetical protein [Ferrimonas balearica]ADN77330.1 hypothetical protein Fbal_3131 [Ferrimonas balearica DSM 9799]
MPKVELEQFTRALTQMEGALGRFVDPDNADGFIRDFALWVIQQWSYRDLFEGRVENASFPCSRYQGKLHPHPTQPATYKDFVGACNAEKAASHCPLSGKTTQDSDDGLYQVFGDACAREFERLVQQQALSLPAELGQGSVSEFVWTLQADPERHPELYECCESIVSRFGLGGTEIEPYLSEIACPKDEPAWQEQRFARWTLADFQKVAADSGATLDLRTPAASQQR